MRVTIRETYPNPETADLIERKIRARFDGEILGQGRSLIRYGEPETELRFDTNAANAAGLIEALRESSEAVTDAELTPDFLDVGGYLANGTGRNADGRRVFRLPFALGVYSVVEDELHALYDVAWLPHDGLSQYGVYKGTGSGVRAFFASADAPSVID